MTVFQNGHDIFFFNRMFMRRFLLVFLMFFTISIHKSNELFGKNIVLIALNVYDCANCINNLRHLSALDTSIGITIVVQSSNDEFKDDILNMFSLKPERYTILADDSLYNQLILSDINSAIALYNDESKVIATRYSLKTGLNDQLIQYYNKLNADSSTFQFNKRFELLAHEALVRDGDFAYSYSRRLPYILRMDFVHQSVDTFVSIDSTMAEIAYNRFFENKDQARKQLDWVKGANLNVPGVMKVVVSSSGKIAVSVNYVYLRFKNDFKDTVGTGFAAVHEFNKSGQLLSTRVIKMDRLRTEFDASTAIRTGEFEFLNDTLLVSLICFSKDKKKSDKFLAYFIPDKNGDYDFLKVFDQSLPAVYADYGTQFSGPVFSNTMDYIGVLLSDTIFSLRGSKAIALGVFKKPQFTGDIFKHNYLLNGIKFWGNYIYATYYDYSDGVKLYFDKFNINTGEIEVHKELIDYSTNKDTLFMYFDSFDPNYYFLKTSSKELVRLRI